MSTKDKHSKRYLHMLCVLASLGYSGGLLSWVSFMHSFTQPLCSHTDDPTFCSPLLSLNTHALSNTCRIMQYNIHIQCNMLACGCRWRRYTRVHSDAHTVHFTQIQAWIYRHTRTVTQILMFRTKEECWSPARIQTAVSPRIRDFNGLSITRTWPLTRCFQHCVSSLCFFFWPNDEETFLLPLLILGFHFCFLENITAEGVCDRDILYIKWR